MDSNIVVFGHRPNDIEDKRFSSVPLDELPLAMVYIPFQPYGEVYGEEEGLKNGTLFKNIDKPFSVLNRRGGKK